MERMPVILIFDVGKTNKKILLFDQHYKVVYEESVHLTETIDEDGFACENIETLTTWIKSSLARLLLDNNFQIQAVNFSGYGASLVFVDHHLKAITPLYNYLKPYPVALQNKFYDDYGGIIDFAKRTASPVLGSLNSAMQLYKIKHEKPEVFSTIRYALHLPQYLSSIFTRKAFSEITSIGCHTNLWDFEKNDYHEWVNREQINSLLPVICKSDACIYTASGSHEYKVGIGLHDSSAALIPYLETFQENFILISTGTWCISLNPFNDSELTDAELEKDCLCYLTFEGKPVKASRLFAGHEHEEQVNRLSQHFDLPVNIFSELDITERECDAAKEKINNDKLIGSLTFQFALNDLNRFSNHKEAYLELMIDIVTRQYLSTTLIKQNIVCPNILIDGGFSKNNIYMKLMASVFPESKVACATISQASALGAALVMHKHWNKNAIPVDLIKLKYF